MKIRTGFVSNSSSSSFIVATKGDIKDVFVDTLNKLDNTDGLPMKEFVVSIMKEVLETLVNNSEKYTLDEYLDEFYWDGDDTTNEKEFANDHPEIYDVVKNHDWNLYEGSVSDEDYEDAGSMMLVYMTIEHMSDDVIIFKDAGY